MSTNLFAKIPSVDSLLKRPGIQQLIDHYSRGFVLRQLDQFLAELRSKIKQGLMDSSELESATSMIEDHLTLVLQQRLAPSLLKVINATGVIVFTNAGRAPMAPDLAERVSEVATSYTNLEYDLKKGSRGHRDQHLEDRIKRLLDCEAATVCNNAAAAVFLILNTLSAGKKALVSRGELVEIGGSFRIPEIMVKSGAVLREVGTTNKTKAEDYEKSIEDDTALILRVHQSNYRIVGFTHRPSLEELVTIADKNAIPLVHDIGSGYLFRTQHPCLQDEPTVEASLAAGSHLICFSGDKLLGGPQAGVIIGKKDLIDRIRKNPLMRACRVDKMTYAALDWTLLQYEKGTFEKTLPVWQLLSEPAESILSRALEIKERISSRALEVSIREGVSLTGGGSAPEEEIPTWLLAITSTRHSPNQLEDSLRSYEIPILSRIEEDQVLLDLRTVFPDQDEIVFEALTQFSTTA